MSKLRKSARGRNCEIRIPGYCCGDPETVVLCHIPSGSLSHKSPDCHAGFGCFVCHGVIDGRVPSRYDAQTLRLYLLEAVIRTQAIWLKEGLITFNE
jgi:hypothetical protein